MLSDNSIQELICSICMQYFKHPVTLPCGHTFCKQQLKIVFVNHPQCPLCRVLFSKTKQLTIDQTINSLLQDIRLIPSRDTYSLFQVDFCQLLLPFNYTLTSLRIIDVSSFSKKNFVARHPFQCTDVFDSEFGVLCDVQFIKLIRGDLYEVVIWGKSYCRIIHEEDGICKVKHVQEKTTLKVSDFKQIIDSIEKITNLSIINNISKRINLEHLFNRKDPLKIFYGLAGITDISNEEKYRFVTCFDDLQRMELLKHFVLPEDKQNSLIQNSFYIYIIFLIVGLMVYRHLF